jgi:hypothetical protein
MTNPSSSRISLFFLVGTLFPIGCHQSTTSQPVSQQPAGTNPAGQTVPQSLGAVHNVRQAVKRAADMAELKNFALAYQIYVAENNRGPSSVADIKSSLDPKMIEGLKDDAVYVAIWNIRNPTGETIVAYAAEPDSYGTRLVAKGDGSVTRMTREDFEKVKPSR